MLISRIIFKTFMLMDKVPPADPSPPTPPPKDPAGDWQAEKARLEAEIAALKTPKKVDPEPDDLAKKAELERQKKEKEAGDTKKLGSAIKFNLKADEWLKTNANLLPKSLESIFAQAEKENYSNDVEKSSALKAAIVSEYFAVQANQDLLTDAQKISLAEFKALTKTEREQRVQDIYDNLFEPAFEAMKRIKKAEQVAKGLGDPTGAESAYEKKMVDLSRKHYLRETK